MEAWRGNYFKLAYLEKAIIDFAYLTPEILEYGYLEEMRLDEDVLNEDISWERMEKYLRLFDSPKLTKTIDLLREFS
ncbi:MAG: hypothetical protein AAGI23_02740 [Bacteroidota bacterium]